MTADHLQAHRAAMPIEAAWHGNGRQSHQGGCRCYQRAAEIVLELLAIDRCRHPQLDIERSRGGSGRHEEIVGLENLDRAPEQCRTFALGSRERAWRLPQALLGVPDGIRLTLVAGRSEPQ